MKEQIEIDEDIENLLFVARFGSGRQFAERLYNAGYRKQSEGEWIEVEDPFIYRYDCSICLERKLGKMTNFCPNCGAKMKGGAK